MKSETLKKLTYNGEKLEIKVEEPLSWSISKIKFTLESKHKLSNPDLKSIQTKLGYSPAGYGFDSHAVSTATIKGENWNYYIWSCSSTCD
jgi:hypothetical protein